jgi:predicted TIM-barrel fold metal-dependent hydrolase
VPAATLANSFEFCQSAAGLGFTLLLYAPEGIAASVAPIRKLLNACPDARVVISHLGNPKVEDGRLVRGEELFQLAECRNVWVLLSGLSMFCEFPHLALREFIVQAIARFGPGRILWGSNFPVSGGVAEYRRDRSAIVEGEWGLDAEARSAILGGTAGELWFREVEPALLTPGKGRSG